MQILLQIHDVFRDAFNHERRVRPAARFHTTRASEAFTSTLYKLVQRPLAIPIKNNTPSSYDEISASFSARPRRPTRHYPNFNRVLFMDISVYFQSISNIIYIEAKRSESTIKCTCTVHFQGYLDSDRKHIIELRECPHKC